MQEENFGTYIKGLRESCNLTLRQVQKDSGVSDSYLSQVETGQRGVPSPDILKKLAPVYKKSYEELLVAAGYLSKDSRDNSTLSDETNIIPVIDDTIIMFPVFGKIAAGKPIPAIHEADEYMPMDTRFFHMNGYTKEDFFFLRINGHSMEPTIVDQDLVLIRKQPTVENHQIAAVLCNGEDATVKRIIVSGEKVILSSDNKDYPPMVYDASECQILGKVLKKIGDVK